MFDLNHAITYIKNDPDRVKNFLIGSIMMSVPVIVSFVFQFIPDNNDKLLLKLLPMIIAGLILMFIFSVILSGYFFKLINTKVREKSELLPDWKKLPEFTLIGLKSFAGSFLYFIPFCIFCLILLLWSSSIHTTNPIFALLLVLLIFPVGFIAAIIFVPICMSFAYDLKISSFIDFKRVCLILNKNIPMFILYFVLGFSVQTIFQVVSFVLGLTIIGIIAIPFIAFYVYLIFADLTAQYINNSTFIKSQITQIQQKGE